MARTSQFLVACIGLAAHGLADPEVSKFMGKAFAPAMPAARPTSPVRSVGKTPGISLDAAGRAPLANPSALMNMQREIAQLEEDNFAMKLELQQFESQIATVASVQSEKPADVTGTQFVSVFGIAAVVGAFLYSVIDKLAKNHPSSMASDNGAELQLAGAGGATVSRSGVPMMTATVPPPSGQVEEPPAPPPLPKIKTMMVGDKTLAGDMNFDPLQLADSPDKLAFYREAEIKHARLAMLAAFGWPVSEVLNFGNLLTGDGRAPSLLNGGLGNVNSVYWGAVFALAIYWEAQGLDKQFGKKDNYLPGMLGFDPLGADSPGMRNAEITNGRVAMIAITVFALEEAVFKSAIFPVNLLQ